MQERNGRRLKVCTSGISFGPRPGKVVHLGAALVHLNSNTLSGNVKGGLGGCYYLFNQFNHLKKVFFVSVEGLKKLVSFIMFAQ